MRRRFACYYPSYSLRPGPHVTLRFFRLFACQLLLILACVLPQAAQAAEGVEIKRAYVEAAEEGYRLAAVYDFDLNRGLSEAIQQGVQLYFTTEIEFTRPRWYWFDEKAIVARQTARISYNVLTRQYHVAIIGSGLQQSFSTLDDALLLIRRPSRWLVAARGALKVGETYNVTLRMGMDRDYLPKPIQVNAFNDSDWRLASDKKTFQYKAE
jgi:hypothetical protein